MSSSSLEYRQRVREWQSHAKNGTEPDEAVSGFGSNPGAATLPFINFLLHWIRKHNVTSVVEAAAGHWPSGWQSTMRWPGIDYIGVDIVPELTRANIAFVKRVSAAVLGLRTWQFITRDIVNEGISGADLLLTKDTLQHLPNADIYAFLQRIARHGCPRLVRYVMSVGDAGPDRAMGVARSVPNSDLDEEARGCRIVDLTKVPFELPFQTAFEWRHLDVQRSTLWRKLVQVWELPPCPVQDA